MTIPRNRLLLLDTTILMDLLRDTPTGKKINAEYKLTERPERPLLCSVVEGEIFALAEANGWGERRRNKLRDLLDELVRVDSSHPSVIAAYAEIYADARKQGELRGENDLWIAATAKAFGAALLTSDTDFLWMDKRHIEVHHVPVVPKK